MMVDMAGTLTFPGIYHCAVSKREMKQKLPAQTHSHLGAWTREYKRLAPCANISHVNTIFT